MATLTAVNPRVISGHMETTKILILNGQSWKKGQFLFVDTAGALKECASNADAATGGVKYLALNDQADPGDTTSTAEVAVITRDLLFEGNELDAAVTRAMIGQQAALDVTSNLVSVDISDTGNDAVEIVDLGWVYEPNMNKSTDVKGRLSFRVMTTNIEAAPV